MTQAADATQFNAQGNGAQSARPAATSSVGVGEPSDVQRTLVVLILGGLALALLAYRALVLTPGRLFDTDEFEHLQATWLMGQGLAIYRDFFEHHPPLLYVLLGSVDGLPDSTEKIFAARMLMIPFSVGILALTWWSAAKHGGRVAGAVACALVSTLVVFQQKVVEIRPDVPALFFLLVAVALQSAAALSPRRLLAIGVTLGCALLFTPKLMFAVPAFALLAIPLGTEQSSVLRRITAFGVGIALPVLIVAVWLNSRDALGSAVYMNMTFNSAVPYTFRSTYLGESIVTSLRQNTLYWLAVAAAFVTAAVGVRWPRTVESRSELVIFAATAGLAVGLFVIPVPLQQYLMFVSTMLAIVVGVQGARLIAAVRHAGRLPQALVFAFGAAVVLHPLPTLLRARHVSNDTQIASLRHIWANVPADSRVFDVWSGMGLFRRPAYYYGFLGPDIIGALTKLNAPALEGDLIASLVKHRPVIISDPLIVSLPPSIIAHVESNYFPDNSGLFLVPVRNPN